MAISIIEGFQEELYLEELFEERKIPKNNDYFLEALIMLKKYEGNTIQIAYESSNFSGIKTLHDYKLIVPVKTGFRVSVTISDGNGVDKFSIDDDYFYYFGRLYEKFPHRCYKIEYKKDPSIYLAIF
ncbi:hypothetical protein [Priestia megaterium]